MNHEEPFSSIGPYKGFAFINYTVESTAGNRAYVIISSIYPTLLFDAIVEYIKDGYEVESVWYKKSWFFATKYYAKLIYSSNKLDICVGPVESR